MIISCDQFLQIRKIDPKAMQGVVFQKYEGRNGPCLATVDAPMSADEALEYCATVVSEGKAKPADRKADNKVYAAGSAE